MKIDIFQTSTGWWVCLIDGRLFYGAGRTRDDVIEYLKQMRIQYED